MVALHAGSDGVTRFSLRNASTLYLCNVRQDLKKDRGWQLDARLLAYAWGLQDSQDWNLGRVRQHFFEHGCVVRCIL